MRRGTCSSVGSGVSASYTATAHPGITEVLYEYGDLNASVTPLAVACRDAYAPDDNNTTAAPVAPLTTAVTTAVTTFAVSTGDDADNDDASTMPLTTGGSGTAGDGDALTSGAVSAAPASTDEDEPAEPALPSTTLPNILIYHPDDMYQGYTDRWQAPNNPGFTMANTPSSLTPNVDRIGAEGAVFTRAYTASSMCSPSRLALLTGRFASRGEYVIAQSTNRRGVASQSTVTVPNTAMIGDDLRNNVASALASVGYRTGQFGKWHLVSEDTLGDLGCNVNSTEYECDYSTIREAVQAAGFDTAEAVYASNLNTCGSTCSDAFSHNMEWVVAETLKFMEDALDDDRPFFAYVNPTIPHGSEADVALQDLSNTTGEGPYYCNDTAAAGSGEVDGGAVGEAWSAACAGSLVNGTNFSEWCSECDMPSRQAVWELAQTQTSNRLTQSRQAVVAAITWLDFGLGSLYTFLEARGALNNTMVIVMSDNGVAKGTVYEMGVRTLMHVRFPDGGVAADTVVDDVVTNMDLVPTIFDVVGVRGSFDTDGLSFRDQLRGGPSVALNRTSVVVEFANDVAVVDVATTGGLKFVRRDLVAGNSIASGGVTGNYPSWDDALQLYNVTGGDSAEQHNLLDSNASSSVQAAVIARLNATAVDHVVNVATDHPVKFNMSVYLDTTTAAAGVATTAPASLATTAATATAAAAASTAAAGTDNRDPSSGATAGVSGTVLALSVGLTTVGALSASEDSSDTTVNNNDATTALPTGPPATTVAASGTTSATTGAAGVATTAPDSTDELGTSASSNRKSTPGSSTKATNVPVANSEPQSTDTGTVTGTTARTAGTSASEPSDGTSAMSSMGTDAPPTTAEVDVTSSPPAPTQASSGAATAQASRGVTTLSSSSVASPALTALQVSQAASTTARVASSTQPATAGSTSSSAPTATVAVVTSKATSPATGITTPRGVSSIVATTAAITQQQPSPVSDSAPQSTVETTRGNSVAVSYTHLTLPTIYSV